MEDRYDEGYNNGFDKGKDEGYVDGYDEGHSSGYSDGYATHEDEVKKQTVADKLTSDLNFQYDGYIAIALPEFIQKLIDNKELLTVGILEELTKTLVDKRVF